MNTVPVLLPKRKKTDFYVCLPHEALHKKTDREIPVQIIILFLFSFFIILSVQYHIYSQKERHPQDTVPFSLFESDVCL